MNCENCTSKQNNCAQSGCGSCCGGTLYLTQNELKLLKLLAVWPFMAITQSISTGEVKFCDIPFDDATVKSLEVKKLVTIDPTIPIENYDYGEDTKGCFCGSVALTKRGQDVLEQMYVHGVEDEA